MFSLPPALHGRNRHFCGLSDFPLNNRRKCIRLFFYHDRQHPVRRRFFPFHAVTTFFHWRLPAWPGLSPIRDLCDASCFSRNGSSTLSVVLRAVLMTTPFS